MLICSETPRLMNVGVEFKAATAAALLLWGIGMLAKADPLGKHSWEGSRSRGSR